MKPQIKNGDNLEKKQKSKRLHAALPNKKARIEDFQISIRGWFLETQALLGRQIMLSAFSLQPPHFFFCNCFFALTVKKMLVSFLFVGQLWILQQFTHSLTRSLAHSLSLSHSQHLINFALVLDSESVGQDSVALPA